MRIVILHPAVSPQATLEDQDSMVQVEAIAESLRRLGHQAVPMPCTLDLAAARRDLLAGQPAAVFNLMESLDGADSLQYVPAALLDALGIRYTGAPTEAIFQTTHKLLAKQLLHLAGLPTPAWIVGEGTEEATSPTQAHRLRPVGNEGEAAWHGPPMPPDAPCIIKAVWEHASRGLDEGNLVAADEREGLGERLHEHQARSGRPCFAEQFIEGREFNLSLLGGGAGPEVLPSAEIDFSAFPPGKPRIVGHRAKWEQDSLSSTIRRGGSISRPRMRSCWPACRTWPGPAGGCSACGVTPGSISGSIWPASRGSWKSTPIRACRPTPVLSPPPAAAAWTSTR